MDAADRVPRRLPTGASRDLMLIASLLPGLVLDLRADWTPLISATDGAEDYGHWGPKAPCNPLSTTHLASLARSVPHSFVSSDAEVKADDAAHVVPLAFEDFKVSFSTQAKPAHASKLEIGALCITVQNWARSTRWHRSRTFNLVGRAGSALCCSERQVWSIELSTRLSPHKRHAHRG